MGDRRAALFRGEFLEGVALPGNLEYETWLLGEREHWQQRIAGLFGLAI